MQTTIRAAVIPSLLLKLDDSQSYTVEYPLSAVIAAEEKLGRSLKAAADWFCAPAKDVPALLEAGLRRHHPDITPEEVQSICDRLNAEAYTELTEALGALNFPAWLARFKENLAKDPKSPKA